MEASGEVAMTSKRADANSTEATAITLIEAATEATSVLFAGLGLKTAFAVKAAACLKVSKSLRSVDLSGNQFTDSDLLEFAAALNESTSIIKIDISGQRTFCSDKVAEAFVDAVRSNGKTTLCSVKTKNSTLLDELAQACRLNGSVVKRRGSAEMEEADAAFAALDDDGGGTISKEELEGHLIATGHDVADIDTLFKLMDTDGDGEISKDEFKAGYNDFLLNPSQRKIDAIIGNKELTTFSITKNLEYQALNKLWKIEKVVANLSAAPHITEVDLSGNKLGNDFAAAFALSVLAKNTTLKKVNLEGNAISGTGITKLADALSTSAVTHFNLSKQQLTVNKSGQNSVAAAIGKNHSVVDFKLDWNDEAAQKLGRSNLKRNRDERKMADLRNDK